MFWKLSKALTTRRTSHPLGYSPRVVPFTGPSSGVFNSDLAYWGQTAYQGTYEGFRIIDTSAPGNPKEILNFTGCVQGTTTDNQGDVIIYDDILVGRGIRLPCCGSFCGGIFTPQGQVGVHIFDVSTQPIR